MERREQAYYHDSFSEKIRRMNYDVPIYRYFPLNYALALLKSGEMFISQTKLWEDTYENFLTKTKFQWGNLPVTFLPFLSGFYGQCWTLLKETDALWRIYSTDKQGVRVKSRINKLLGASLNEIDSKQFSTRIRIIGQVAYRTEKQINTWMQKQNEGLINDMTLRESLFIKRKEFSHEKEVRLIIHKSINQEDENKGIENPGIKLKIEPNELVEEVTFDPRLGKSDYETYSDVFRSIGYKNKITKSNLYDFKPIILKK